MARGEVILSPAIAARLVDVVRSGSEPATGLAESFGQLTPRELVILRLIAAGKDSAEIAAELRVSPHTVKNHVANILGKLLLENRVQAAVQAVRSGFA